MCLEELGYVSCLDHYDHCCKKRYPFYPHVCLASDSYTNAIGLRCQRPKQLHAHGAAGDVVAYESMLSQCQEVGHGFLSVNCEKRDECCKHNKN